MEIYVALFCIICKYAVILSELKKNEKEKKYIYYLKSVHNSVAWYELWLLYLPLI